MPGIQHALLISAAPETVFEALTTTKGLAGWWTPGATAKPELQSVAQFPFGDNYKKEMKVTGLKPFDTVEWDCIAGADEWVGTSISFQLVHGTPEELLRDYPEMLGQLEQSIPDSATLVLFKHDNWRGETLMFAECSYTWGRFLRSLKMYCERGTGMPWPEQHV